MGIDPSITLLIQVPILHRSIMPVRPITSILIWATRPIPFTPPSTASRTDIINSIPIQLTLKLDRRVTLSILCRLTGPTRYRAEGLGVLRSKEKPKKTELPRYGEGKEVVWSH